MKLLSYAGKPGKIFFLGDVLKGPLREKSIEIFSVDGDGGNCKQLTDSLDQVWNWAPVISSDGQQVVFASSRTRDSGIYIMDADGTHQRRLGLPNIDGTSPCFSPDGKQVGFQMSNGDEGSMIHLINTDGTDLRQISRKTDSSRIHDHPVFTQNGDHIIYESETLNIADIATGEIKPIFKEPIPEELSCTNVITSPDGHKIAFCGGICTWYVEDHYEWTYKICTANIDGSNFRIITPQFFTASNPEFGPKGDAIVFTAQRKKRKNRHIYFARLDGSDPVKVTSEFSSAHNPSFSPDGKSIAFIGLKQGNSKRHIYTAQIDGSNVEQITDVDMFIGALNWARNPS
jgi:Tol biopolymer transport system component